MDSVSVMLWMPCSATPVLPGDRVGQVDQVGTLRLRQRVNLEAEPPELLLKLSPASVWFLDSST